MRGQIGLYNEKSAAFMKKMERKKWMLLSFPPFLSLMSMRAEFLIRKEESSRTRRFDLPAAFVAIAPLLIDKRVPIQSTLIDGDGLRNLPKTRDTRMYKR